MSVTRRRLPPGLPRLKPDSPVCREHVPRKPRPRRPGGHQAPSPVAACGSDPAARHPAGRRFRPRLALLALAVQVLPEPLLFLRGGRVWQWDTQASFHCRLQPLPPASERACARRCCSGGSGRVIPSRCLCHSVVRQGTRGWPEPQILSTCMIVKLP